MKRPALLVTICLIISIIITKEFGIAVLLALLFIISTYFIISRKKFTPLIILTLIVCLACSLFTAYKTNRKSSLYEYENINIEFTGIALQPAKHKDNYTEYIFKISEAPFNSTGEKILLRVYNQSSANDFIAGEVYKINAEIDIPSEARNPGGFDYSLYLQCKGIYTIGKCDYSDTEFVEKQNLPFFLDDVYALRTNIINTLYDNLPKENAGLIASILFGTNDIDEDVLNDFRKAGVAHILAVSGLHVSTVCFIVNFALDKIKFKRKPKYFVKILFPYFYLMLAGFGVSILRACIMNTISVTAKEVKKHNDLFNSVCIAALISLIINPLYLYNVSFQLSYSCVISIALFGELISSKIKRLKLNKFVGYVLSFIGFNISVNLVMLPISIYYFSSLSTVSLIANFLIVPLMTALMLLVISALILTPILKPLSILLYKILNIVLIYIKAIPNLLMKFRFSSVDIPTPHLYSILAYYLLLLIIFGYLSVKNGLHRKVILLVLICVISMFSFNIYTYSANKIYFLDVGQGDCAFIKAYGETVLIDTGKEYNFESVIQPFLYKTSTYKIDKVIITHADSDHSGGILELMDNVKIDTIYFNECDKGIYYEVSQKSAEYGIQLKSVYAGSNINNWISVISPLKDYNHSNNNSIVLDVTIQGSSILFLADIETEAIEDLIEYGELRQYDIVKCMHHGASYSNSENFYSILNPETAVISVGENSYGLPHNKTYSQLYNLGTRVYRTDESGCLIFDFNDSGYRVKRYINN